jgi:hypothetical protein
MSAVAPTLAHALLVRKGEAAPAGPAGRACAPRRARIRLEISRALGLDRPAPREADRVEAAAPR